ncbi:dialkylrecorsinol condensing enzyme [Chitinophaga sp. Cy-1792]|uniref:dialkylrecorsinol condensing enzyme n=1 Tax=Chitinophaga sp. Cy-1792 TaxID=2608339 RepID=UPI00141DB447|nr:dialkylrecorsinol condensing enzyme [Chitinophaga sp. Cy-1792]NIG53312.1 dialkylresorcinol condensing enzyme [Chitinophaga sp. Cy-1792]
MNVKPKVLVVYYTQTGQLRRIVDHVLAPLEGKVDVTYEQLVPVEPFVFPWKKETFYDTMPETVLGRPRGIQPLKVDVNAHFDLVLLAYQPWFLSPSQPTAAFLQSGDAAKLLKGKTVVTLVGGRNMWLNAQETVKQHLDKAGAKLAGNIVLVDKSPNLVSLVTVLRWLFKGKKEASRFLPQGGVQENEIITSKRFAGPLGKALESADWQPLQGELLAMDAVELIPDLILLEDRGIKAFRYWAKFISAKGGPGEASRKPRVSMYRSLLIPGIIVLSPVTIISSLIKKNLKKAELQRKVDYYKGVSLRN